MERRKDPGTDVDPRRRGGDGPPVIATPSQNPPRLAIGRSPEELVAGPDDVEPDLLGSDREVADIGLADHRRGAEPLPHWERPISDGRMVLSLDEDGRVDQRSVDPGLMRAAIQSARVTR